MRYPTCFVLIAEDVLSTILQEQQETGDRRTKQQAASDPYRFLHPRLPIMKLPGAKRRSYLAARALQRALRIEPSLTPDLDFYHINSMKIRFPHQSAAEEMSSSENRRNP